MGGFTTRLLYSFRTKVIVPVILVMVLIMVAAMWLVGHQVKRQIMDSARQQLAKDADTFKSLDERHVHELFWRYGNMRSDPQFKAATELIGISAPVPARKPPAFKGGQYPAPVAPLPRDVERARATLRGIFNDMISDGVAEVISLSSAVADDHPLTVAGNPQFDLTQFESDCAATLARVKREQRQCFSRHRVGDRLYDVVALPILRDGLLTGVISFGVTSSSVQEFKKLTSSDVVLLDRRGIIATTLPAGLQSQVAALSVVKDIATHPGEGRAETDVVLGGGHFICLDGILDGQNPLFFLILFSREQQLSELRATQENIFLVSLCAIMLGTLVVWLAVRKVVEPLEQLHDTVEAIGRGDYTRRVEVRSRDECAELAREFNRMMDNLKFSRDELESAVERLRATQSQLIQSEKLSGIGEFVAGVAHELNNPLTTVMGFSELLKSAGGASPEHVTFLDMIHKSAQRCQKIVQALLGFARRHQPERNPACVNRLIEASLEILSYQLRTSNIETKLSLDPKLPLAMVDSHQIQQVLVNIINNARHAIEAHQPGGWIRIVTTAQGDHVHITIQDSGPGIAPENLSKIFDPFFTTKEVGKGTGLGLSLCYGIIREHGGNIFPTSRPGEGAMFTIELPITCAAGVDSPAKVETPPIGKSAEGGGKRVLVIDDEEPILNMMNEMLSRQGYQVDTAVDGEAGLGFLRKTDYDAVLCDWRMPGLTGRDVYEKIRERSPAQAQRLIFISGDLVNDRTRKFFEAEKKFCLPKPFSIGEFNAAIRQVVA